MKFVDYNNEKLSKLSLGTVQFGLDYGIANSSGQPTQNSVNEIVEYVYSNGINCFDTAQAYGNSEEVLGKALLNKKNLFVISKLKSELFKDNLEENVSKSLNNLGLSGLYGLLLHDSKLLYNWDKEYTEAVNKLVKSCKIKHFGVSIYSSEDFDLAINNDIIELIQIPFNLFDQRAIKENWFSRAKEKNKLIIIRSVFLQGLLLMEKENIPLKLNSAVQYIKIIELFARELNISKHELALSFVDAVARDSLILFGCDNIEQAKENIIKYNSLKQLDNSTILKIREKLSNVDEKIFNPTKW